MVHGLLCIGDNVVVDIGMSLAKLGGFGWHVLGFEACSILQLR